MRKILFRGKREDNQEWVYGVPTTDDYDAKYIIQGIFECDEYRCNGADCYNVDENTISEFTGLTDKNGTKIFEGDICRFREWSKGDMCWVGKVHYEHQQFVISGNPNKECESEFLLAMSRFIPENIEVIGNIHDNPELLGGGEE